MKLRYLIPIVAAFAFSFASCSSEDMLADIENSQEIPGENPEENRFGDVLGGGEISGGTIRELSRVGNVTTYQLAYVAMFNADSQSGWEWEEENYYECYGIQLPLSGRLAFQDGKLWETARLFSLSFGPLPVSTAWSAYCRATGEKKQLYVTSGFEYNESESLFNIDGAAYEVLEFNASRLRLSFETTYMGGRTHEGGKHKFVLVYEIADPVRFESDNVLQFNSDIECYWFIYNTAHDYFGEYIDLNAVYAPDVIFDNPIFDLDQVEKWIRSIGG